eukprot:SAG31_NODE_302_length_18087_cov_97.056982_11_plen_82_part_00
MLGQRIRVVADHRVVKKHLPIAAEVCKATLSRQQQRLTQTKTKYARIKTISFSRTAGKQKSAVALLFVYIVGGELGDVGLL